MPIALASAEPFVSAPGESWVVCHTRPRCEKKFSRLLQAERMVNFLPVIDSVRQYEHQTKHFTKPLFPGYVFARVPEPRHARLFQQDLLVRVIRVDDEPRFLRQLQEIRAVLSLGWAVALRPLLKRGTHVKVVAGPLHGLEGMVEDVSSIEGIIIAVDVLQQGLLVKIPLEHLRVLP